MINDKINKGTGVADTYNESGGNDNTTDSGQVGSEDKNSVLLDRTVQETGSGNTKGETKGTKANGAYRFDDAEHVHTIDGRPLTGTSTVVGILAKPLSYWAVGLALAKLGWVKPKEKIDGKYITTPKELRLTTLEKTWNVITKLPIANVLELLDTAYHAHTTEMKDSAKKGKDRHTLCEEYVKASMAGKELPHDESIKAFTDWAEKNVERFIWSEANCYSVTHWVGGISDCGAILKDGKKVIIDFKSSKEAYHSQFIQIAGYDLQISENGCYTAKGDKILDPIQVDGYIVFPFGATKPEPAYYWNVKEAREVFLAVLKIYRFLPQ